MLPDDFVEMPDPGEISTIEQDWKVVFGALAVQVSIAHSQEGEQRQRHLDAAMQIIKDAYSYPAFLIKKKE